MTLDFGRYGRLAVGEAKYASIVPHHMLTDDAGRHIRHGERPYVNTYAPAHECLLRAIFDDRDPASSSTEAVIWRGHDGEEGQYFLWRTWGGVDDYVPIPAACVEWFAADVTEEEKRPEYESLNTEWDPEITQTCFRCIVRGASDNGITT